jgi:hypothetical protein
VALQDKLRASAGTVIGEPVEQVIAVQSFPEPLVLLALFGVLPAFLLLYLSTFIWGSPYRLVAVTKTRIVVLHALRTSYRKATAVERELPRWTQLGPVTGSAIRIDGKRWYVIAGTKKCVAAADQARPGQSASPPVQGAVPTASDPYLQPSQQGFTAPPAGWYPDPAGGAGLRYWSGREWTAHTDGPSQGEA